jgi:3-oxoacyl-[acyl-carrier protein] reductase
MAQAFADAGDEVVITGRRQDVLAAAASELGGNVSYLRVDASDPTQVEAATATMPDTVDVLINNAGGNTGMAEPSPSSLAEVAAAWQANLSANLISAVLMTSALEPRLSQGGAVISFSSIAAHRPGAAAYGAAKAAVEAWNRTLAHELGTRQITANVIAPGYTEATEFFRDQMTDQRRAALISQTATGRSGTPADMAALAFFLASPAAGQITGQVLHVNGGALTT